MERQDHSRSLWSNWNWLLIVNCLLPLCVGELCLLVTFNSETHFVLSNVGLFFGIVLLWAQGRIFLAMGGARVRAAVILGAQHMAFLQLIFVIHLFVGFIALILTWSIIERDWLDSIAGAAGYGFFVTMMTGQPLMILGFTYGYFHRRVARIVDDEVDE